MMLQFEFIKHWVMSRFKERTTWDGTVIVGISLLALLSLPLVKWLAWGGVVYGAWTIWKKENEN